MSGEPKPPAGLRAPGKQLWSDISRYVLTGGELEVLRQAVRVADECDKWERELRSAPSMVPGHHGQPRPNPLIRILQDHRMLLRRLIDSLNLPDEDQESGLRPGQKHAQKAANARWSPAAAQAVDRRLFTADKVS
jgi:hypothetical protein